MTNKHDFQTHGRVEKNSNSSIVEKNNTLKNNSNGTYKVLIADLIGMKFDQNGDPDYSEVRDYIEEKGGVFHLGPIDENSVLDERKIHFFYQPDLSRIDEILPQTNKGQYQALIAAATFIVSVPSAPANRTIPKTSLT